MRQREISLFLRCNIVQFREEIALVISAHAHVFKNSKKAFFLGLKVTPMCLNHDCADDGGLQSSFSMRFIRGTAEKRSLLTVLRFMQGVFISVL